MRQKELLAVMAPYNSTRLQVSGHVGVCSVLFMAHCVARDVRRVLGISSHGARSGVLAKVAMAQCTAQAFTSLVELSRPPRCKSWWVPELPAWRKACEMRNLP